MTQPDQPGNYFQQPGYLPAAKTNTLAIVSLVAGLCWILWLGSIAAVVCGLLALGQIRANGESGHGLALAGIVLGCVGLVTLLGFILVGFFLAHGLPGPG